MPFVKRQIEPSRYRRHKKGEENVFENYPDVANNALANALLQLSSLTFHAEDIFHEIENEARTFHKRIQNVDNRIQKMHEKISKLDHKAVQIPVSDLDTEFKIPDHLQYRSCDSVEEDLFTTDSRTPCLIHLHQLTRSDLNGVLRGDQTYAKPQRPKSFDPNVLLDEKTSTASVLSAKSSVNIVASAELNEVFNPQGLLPTPEKKMQLDSAQHRAQVIAVDTSGTFFDRRVNLRRSQRSTVTGPRKKNQQKLKERHKTLTALPDYVSSELGLHAMHRQSSLHSDVNSLSSFLGDGSVASADSSLSQREHACNDLQIADPKQLLPSPIRRRFKNRYSMSMINSMPPSPRTNTRTSMEQPPVAMSTFPRHSSDINEPTKIYAKLNGNHFSDDLTNNPKQESFMREKSIAAEDRISSGFWSGTESCRHSTASDNLAQHNGVAQASQQVHHKQNSSQSLDNDTCESSLSLNSRLSTLEHSLSSSIASLSHTPADITPTPDDSSLIQNSNPVSPSRLNFNTPAGAYNFMNPDYVEKPISFYHFASPMNPLILGFRRGHDGHIRDDMGSFDSSARSCKDNIKKEKYQVDATRSDYYPVFSPTTPHPETLNHLETPPTVSENAGHFFSSIHSAATPSVYEKSKSFESKGVSQNGSPNDLQAELKARLHHRRKTFDESTKKPSPPRRCSSLKRSNREEKAYMEPLKSKNITTLNSLISEKPKESFPYRPPNSSIIKSNRSMSPSRLSCSSFESDSEQSNSNSPLSLRKTYQPSKTVASCLKSRRPATIYNFHISAQSDGPLPCAPEPIVNNIEFTDPSPVSSKQLQNHLPPSSNNSQIRANSFSSTISSSLPEKRDAETSFTISPTQLKRATQSLKQVLDKEIKPDADKITASQCQDNVTTLSTTTKQSNDTHLTNGLNGNIFMKDNKQTKPLLSPLPTSKESQLATTEKIPLVISNESPNKTPSATKPPSPNKKPPIRPKPASLKAKSTPNDEISQVGVKSRQLKSENANLRAAFFASLTSPQDKFDNSKQIKDEKIEKPDNDEVKMIKNKSCEATSNTISKETTENISSSLDCDKENKHSSCSSAVETTNQNLIRNFDGGVTVEASLTLDRVSPFKEDNSAVDLNQSKKLELSPKIVFDIPLNEFRGKNSAEPEKYNGFNGLVGTTGADGDETETLKVLGSSCSNLQKSTFNATIHRPRASYSVLPSENGVLSPSVNNFDRKSNFRYSTSSLERRRKPQSNSAARDDFKALLLQNLSKSGSGSQMSATQKLQASLQTARLSTEGEDVSDGRTDAKRHQIVSAGDIRAAMTTSRPGRRPNRMPEHRRSYAGLTNHSSKKHPPISMSGRYSARSRTPTRPMMAIREDVENETTSEKGDNLLQRPKSVGDF